MDGSLSPKPESKVSKELKPRRKVVQKTVVRVQIDTNGGKQKSEGPPSDSWSWRKYGQKPIKGSPYPRGYYRCSTSKGCSAKKQVERCRTDASMLIITYTSTHNHPGPDLHTQTQTQTQPNDEIPTTPKQEQDQNQNQEKQKQQKQNQKQQQQQQQQDPPNMTSDEDTSEDHNFLYFQSHDIIINQEENPLSANLESTLLLDEEPLSYPHLMNFSTPKSEENDFFDELEELPTSSSFTSFMRNNFFEERILVLPS